MMMMRLKTMMMTRMETRMMSWWWKMMSLVPTTTTMTWMNTANEFILIQFEYNHKVKAYLVCEFVILIASSSPEEGGADEYDLIRQRMKKHKDDEKNEDTNTKAKKHLVCEFVILMASSSPGEGGAGEEPLSQDFVLVTWEGKTRCHLRLEIVTFFVPSCQ